MLTEYNKKQKITKKQKTKKKSGWGIICQF